MHTAELVLKSIQYRKTVLSMIAKAGAGHTGGSLSCVDILNVLYNHVMDITPENVRDVNRDHYVHSKGHSVEALYAVLADKGFFGRYELDTLCRPGSHWVGHPTRKVPGVEQNTGALGHGLSVAVGMAIAAKLDGRPNRIFTLMGDGELTEGSIWEASMSASFYRLDNLTAIVDRNTLQMTGRTEEVMALEPLAERFGAFGYAVRTVDGNDVVALVELLTQVPFELGRASLIIARTTKGKGFSLAEDSAKWHHHVPAAAELVLALAELDQAEEHWQEQYGPAATR
jgi:transketolase